MAGSRAPALRGLGRRRRGQPDERNHGNGQDAGFGTADIDQLGTRARGIGRPAGDIRSRVGTRPVGAGEERLDRAADLLVVLVQGRQGEPTTAPLAGLGWGGSGRSIDERGGIGRRLSGGRAEARAARAPVGAAGRSGRTACFADAAGQPVWLGGTWRDRAGRVGSALARPRDSARPRPGGRSDSAVAAGRRLGGGPPRADSVIALASGRLATTRSMRVSGRPSAGLIDRSTWRRERRRRPRTDRRVSIALASGTNRGAGCGSRRRRETHWRSG